MTRPTLTAREAAFVRHFRGKARGNATQAAILAGYAKNSARITACRLLAKANISAELSKAIAGDAKTERAGAEERDRLCSAFVRDPKLPVADRLSALKELNKVDGRHTVRHQIEGKVTLEQALAASREDE